MKWPAALFATPFLLVGCRTPAPSMNLFAPYGATRVPPPPTGSYSKPDTYYQPSTQPAPPAGLRSELNHGATSPLADAKGEPGGNSHSGHFASDVQLATADWEATRPPRDPAIRLASASRSLEAESPVRVIESKGVAGSTRMELKGMPVNDATISAAGDTRPSASLPATLEGHHTDISQLPKPTVSTSDPRESTGATATTRTAETPAANGGGSSTSESANGWRTRPDARKPLRVAGR